jgi:hypothetical protein
MAAVTLAEQIDLNIRLCSEINQTIDKLRSRCPTTETICMIEAVSLLLQSLVDNQRRALLAEENIKQRQSYTIKELRRLRQHVPHELSVQVRLTLQDVISRSMALNKLESRRVKNGIGHILNACSNTR